MDYDLQIKHYQRKLQKAINNKQYQQQQLNNTQYYDHSNILLPIELLQIILEKCRFIDQIRLRQVCKYFCHNLKITNFCYIENKYLIKLSDNIINSYPDIKSLKIVTSSSITNKGIKYRTGLSELIDESGKIKNSGIKLLKLTKLKIPQSLFGDTSKIDDDGIKNMTTLKYLLLSNSKVTDMGLKNLKLKSLFLNYNTNITNAGIKHLNLEDFRMTHLITYDGIAHMNLRSLSIKGYAIGDNEIKNFKNIKRLYIIETNQVTNDGLKHLQLEYLSLNRNYTITYDGIAHMNLTPKNISTFKCALKLPNKN